jgi:hypothetical protein
MLLKGSVRLALFCAVVSLPLAAQTTGGSITGTVMDAQNAVVPKATVKATNLEQNAVFTTSTDASGIFVFPQLQPAGYAVTVEKDGFRKFEQRGVVLEANTALALPPIKLEVGAVTQAVEVVAQGEQVQTSSDRGDTIVSKQLESVEVKGRTYLALLQLNPGVRTDRDFSTNTNELGNIYANGSRGNQQHLTINGVTDTDYGANGRMLATVSVDAVQELKVLTGNYTAEYGFGSGAEISVVTKSGATAFHGAGYWYFRDKGMNANTWRNNRDGVAKAYYHQNYVGYQIGGPVYIPHKFNTGKEKLFFFWSEEYQRQLFPADGNGNSIFRTQVPTALERQGDFSQSVDKNNCPITTGKTGCPSPPMILDPTTRVPYPNGQIPQSLLYGPGIKLLNLLPLPNAPGNTGYNYVYQASGVVPRHEQTLRMDFNPTEKWRLYGTWVQTPTDYVDINASPSGYGIMPNFPITSVKFNHPALMSTLNVMRILSPRMTNEASFALNYHANRINPDNPAAISNSATGINLPTLYPQFAGYIPNFGFAGTRLGTSPTLKYVGVGSNGAYAPWFGPVTILEWADNFSLVRSKHLIKAGIYYHRDRKGQMAYLESEGVYDYGDSASNPYDTHDGFANAALGVYTSFTQANHLLSGQYRFTNLEWYAQDTWRVTPRLTLDYGLRFYWIQPWFDNQMQISNFFPSLYDRSKAPLLYQPALDASNSRVAVDPRNPSVTLPNAYIGTVIPGTGPLDNGILQAGHGINQYVNKAPGIKLAPRFGVAFDLTGHQNLIFRAGGGIMYDRPEGNEIFSLLGNPPEALQTTLVNGLVKQLSPAAAITGVPTLSGVAGGALDYGGKDPTAYKFNAGIQVRLPWSMLLDTSYVGNLGRHLIYNYPLNAIPYGADYLPQNQDPTKVKLSPTATLGSNAYDAQFLRPFNGFGAIGQNVLGASSNYNSLQVTLRRRFASGLFLGMSYTWGRCMDAEGVRIDGKTRFGTYAPCSYDVGQTLVFNYVYELPKIDRLGAFNNPVTRAVFNGWQVAGTTLFRSGTPFSVGYSISGYGNAQLTGSPDFGARVKLVGDPRAGIGEDPYNRINPAAFLPPQPGSVGLESGYNYMRNPGLNNWDLTLQKSIPLGGEKVHMVLRADAFNAFNHTQFNGINSTISYASPTSTAPIPSSLFPANINGFGTVSGTAPARIMQVTAHIVF